MNVTALNLLQNTKAENSFVVFQIITAIVGAALLVVAVIVWLSGLYSGLPALIAFGGSGWLVASFLPTWLARRLDGHRQLSQNQRLHQTDLRLRQGHLSEDESGGK